MADMLHCAREIALPDSRLVLLSCCAAAACWHLLSGGRAGIRASVNWACSLGGKYLRCVARRSSFSACSTLTWPMTVCRSSMRLRRIRCALCRFVIRLHTQSLAHSHSIGNIPDCC